MIGIPVLSLLSLAVAEYSVPAVWQCSVTV